MPETRSPNTDEAIHAAIQQYGAKAVYEASMKHMEGDSAALESVGLKIPARMREVGHIAVVAVGRMAPHQLVE